MVFSHSLWIFLSLKNLCFSLSRFQCFTSESCQLVTIAIFLHTANTHETEWVNECHCVHSFCRMLRIICVLKSQYTCNIYVFDYLEPRLGAIIWRAFASLTRILTILQGANLKWISYAFAVGQMYMALHWRNAVDVAVSFLYLVHWKLQAIICIFASACIYRVYT